MWLQRFTNYLITHLWQTFLLTFLLAFIPLIGISVAIIVAALITLCVGVSEGLVLTVAATLPFIISFYLSVDTQVAIPLVVWAAVGVGVISNVLTYVFALMLRQRASWSLIIQIAALIGVLVISIIHLTYPDIANWWGAQLQTYVMQAKSLTNAKAGIDFPLDTQLETINVTKQYATGFMVAAILFNAILQLVVARWWQASVFKDVILRYELHRIRLSHLAGTLFIFAILLSYWGNSVVLDIMPVLYLLFSIAGLSIIHYFLSFMKSKTTWFWISILYLILLFSIPTSLILLSIFALFDIWLDLRKRFKNLHKT